MVEEYSESSVELQTIKDVNKNSWDSSLYRWSSITENIQFADSDSSRNAESHSRSEVDRSEEKDRETLSMGAAVYDEIKYTDCTDSDSYGNDIHEAYSQDDLEESAETNSGRQIQEFLDKKFQIFMHKKMCPANVQKYQLPLIETEVQMEYIKKKIKNLDKKDGKGKQNQVTSVTSVSKNIKGEAYQLENARNVERLKVNNILLEVNKKIAVPVHQPKKCKQCRNFQGKLTQESYIKKKIEILQKQQFEKDFEKHLYEKDSATLIANIINCGSGPNDPPPVVWDRLLRKGQYS